jgi:hypothetical protein
MQFAQALRDSTGVAGLDGQMQQTHADAATRRLRASQVIVGLFYTYFT